MAKGFKRFQDHQNEGSGEINISPHRRGFYSVNLLSLPLFLLMRLALK